MSRYSKPNYVPWIAGVILLGGFIAIVATMTGKDDEQGQTHARGLPPPPGPEPERPPEPPPYEEPEEEYEEPAPPPKPSVSPKQAEKMLRGLTRAWRTYAVDLCRKQKWPDERARQFLQKVTWNNRDLEKQHTHGLESLRRMLDLDTTDAVTLAETFMAQEVGDEAFFNANWKKLDIDYKPGPKKVVALEDAWKPNRIRWGFPLDTPIRELQEFKLTTLQVAMQGWALVASTTLQGQEQSAATVQEFMRTTVGTEMKLIERKMRAGLCVLLDMPDAPLHEVAKAFVQRIDGKERDAVAQEFATRVEKAVEAAQNTE